MAEEILRQRPNRVINMIVRYSWFTDGVKAFRDAIRLDPAYRSDPELVKTAIRGFITTPDTDPRIEELLRDLGDAAKPALEETAKSHPNATIRARAAAELRRLP